MKIGREQILQQLEEAELIPMKQMIPRIAASFIQLFREYHATARVIIPALKTGAILWCLSGYRRTPRSRWLLAVCLGAGPGCGRGVGER